MPGLTKSKLFDLMFVSFCGAAGFYFIAHRTDPSRSVVGGDSGQGLEKTIDDDGNNNQVVANEANKGSDNNGGKGDNGSKDGRREIDVKGGKDGLDSNKEDRSSKEEDSSNQGRASNMDKICSGNVREGVFFLEVNSSLTSFRGPMLCAFESAADKNPDKQIYVIVNVTSKVQDLPSYLTTRYPNLKLLRINFNDVVAGTPLEKLYHSGRIRRSNHGDKYAFVSISDTFREVFTDPDRAKFLNKIGLYENALLHKCGGFYLDTDILLLRALPTEEENFMVAQNHRFVNNAVMRVRKGHPLMVAIMNKEAETFNAEKYGENGPFLITRIMGHLCKDSEGKNFNSFMRCPGKFAVLPPKHAYAINYPAWKMFFQPEQKQAVLHAIADSFAVHYWGSGPVLGWDDRYTHFNKSQPIYEIFERACPMTESQKIRKEVEAGLMIRDVERVVGKHMP